VHVVFGVGEGGDAEAGAGGVLEVRAHVVDGSDAHFDRVVAETGLLWEGRGERGRGRSPGGRGLFSMGGGYEVSYGVEVN